MLGSDAAFIRIVVSQFAELKCSRLAPRRVPEAGRGGGGTLISTSLGSNFVFVPPAGAIRPCRRGRVDRRGLDMQLGVGQLGQDSRELSLVLPLPLSRP